MSKTDKSGGFKLLFRRLRHQFAKAAIGTLADVDNVFL